jgi:hypothetical protein
MSAFYSDLGYSVSQRRKDDEAEAYSLAYAMEDERRRQEWEAEFDTIPYRSNGAEIHRAVMARKQN